MVKMKVTPDCNNTVESDDSEDEAFPNSVREQIVSLLLTCYAILAYIIISLWIPIFAKIFFSWVENRKQV